MYRTTIKNKMSGPFGSCMVVSMRIFNKKDIKIDSVESLKEMTKISFQLL